MNDPVLDKASDILREVVQALDEPPVVVTKACIIVEYMDTNGEKWLRTLRNEDLRSWECRGMLAEVLSDLDAYTVADALDDE